MCTFGDKPDRKYLFIFIQYAIALFELIKYNSYSIYTTYNNNSSYTILNTNNVYNPYNTHDT